MHAVTIRLLAGVLVCIATPAGAQAGGSGLGSGIGWHAEPLRSPAAHASNSLHAPSLTRFEGFRGGGSGIRPPGPTAGDGPAREPTGSGQAAPMQSLRANPH